jgi:pimeloyl-ACP methyl ester carboxylesterase
MALLANRCDHRSRFVEDRDPADVRQIVRSLGFDTINLLGTDIGTMVAYAYAPRHPEEVRRLGSSRVLDSGLWTRGVDEPGNRLQR